MTSMIMSIMGSLMVGGKLSLEILGYLFIVVMIKGLVSSSNLFWKVSFMGGGSGGDIMSYSMLMLTMLVGLLMLLGETKVKSGMNSMPFKSLVLMIVLFLCLAFSVMSSIMFYLFFELVLIPMILLIMIYGYQPERLESGIYMLMYTVFGSLPLLSGMILMWGGGSLNFFYSGLMKVDYLLKGWGSLILLGFLVKLPSYGFHIWLPKAHVEAPVSGSSVLAGVLLKLGCYGFYRFYEFTMLCKMIESLMLILGLWGGLMSSLMCLRQLDSKKLVAYSSVVHSGIFLGGVVGMSGVGLLGGLLMMLGHGLCSSGLFYMVNMIYERVSSRSMMLVKGLLGLCPNLMMWSFLLVISNSAAPPFLNFFGEFMLGMGVLEYELWLSVLLFMIYFIGVGYSIYFYSVINHGGGNFGNFIPIKVGEYYILLMHFWPVLGLIFFLKDICI